MRRTIELLQDRWRARRAQRTARGRERGMSLLEIMIVLALIGLVTTAIIAGVIPQFNKGKIKTAKTALVQIGGAAAQYAADNDGKCPSMDELVTSGFLNKSAMKDPWGSPYMIKDCSGADGARALSLGPDKAEGTADDVKSFTE